MQENEQFSYNFLVSLTATLTSWLTVHIVPNRLDSKIVQVWNQVFPKHIEKYLFDHRFLFVVFFVFVFFKISIISTIYRDCRYSSTNTPPTPPPPKKREIFNFKKLKEFTLEQMFKGGCGQLGSILYSTYLRY